MLSLRPRVPDARGVRRPLIAWLTPLRDDAAGGRPGFVERRRIEGEHAVRTPGSASRMWRVSVLPSIPFFFLPTIVIVIGASLDNIWMLLLGPMLGVSGPAAMVYFARVGGADVVVSAYLHERRCPSCGYDLSGVPADDGDGSRVCPECGGAWCIADNGVDADECAG